MEGMSIVKEDALPFPLCGTPAPDQSERLIEIDGIYERMSFNLGRKGISIFFKLSLFCFWHCSQAVKGTFT